MRKSMYIIGLMLVSMFTLTGCVDQSQGSSINEESVSSNTEQVLSTESQENTLVATSMATVEICEKLNLPLVGIPESSLSEAPERYADLPTIGSPMSPDMEILASLKPDWILSPVSLISDLQPKYEAIGSDYAFLNLSSVEGMYKSILQLGTLFDREEEANKLLEEFEEFYKEYKEKQTKKENPTVLILMGLPGSYVVATEESYVGNLVKLAGGINVYQGESEDFLNINTEDMLEKDPDIILRTAHALPDQVQEMFAEEFATNDIWKHFRAVKEEKVYDLSYSKFGMSANFSYPEALEELDTILYSNDGE